MILATIRKWLYRPKRKGWQFDGKPGGILFKHLYKCETVRKAGNNTAVFLQEQTNLRLFHFQVSHNFEFVVVVFI